MLVLVLVLALVVMVVLVLVLVNARHTCTHYHILRPHSSPRKERMEVRHAAAIGCPTIMPLRDLCLPLASAPCSAALHRVCLQRGTGLFRLAAASACVELPLTLA